MKIRRLNAFLKPIGTRVVLVSLTLLLPFALPVQADTSKTNNAERLETVNKDIKKLHALLDKIRKERSSIEARLETTEREISRVQKDLKQTERELEEAKATAKKQQAQREALRQEQNEKQQSVSKALKAAYVAGKNPQIKLLLNQENPAKANRMMAYYNHFALVQSASLAALKETDRQLAIAETRLEKTNQQIVQHQQALTSREQTLKKSKGNRHQVLAKLAASEKQSHSRLGKLEEEQKALQQLLASITSIADITSVDQPFSKVRGKMPWPVHGKLLHRFGDRRDNTKLTWPGIYIRASAGTPVKAPHHGRVVFADWMKSFGQLMIIDHGNGYMTLYAHTQDMLKTEGDWVLPGETIALVGDSGGQTQPGLYFEIRYKGKPSNPARWLVASR
ncbi:murein hydrolase activator EnvC family protein [Sansalvadorimonas verongulae]|uniref:murein hydrolase activator EnvC family protein n=1 Tax=Sansalvadorimonas verongulae TaxID=2172824 RepID=UPI0012BD2BEB|nr:peptidoglycan DD-metalloendopeptidase family protein [Sansalvadorimonas verongulae]MTI15016.1 hypothetical protein [Sansalvadorimonas verongulae]